MRFIKNYQEFRSKDAVKLKIKDNAEKNIDRDTAYLVLDGGAQEKKCCQEACSCRDMRNLENEKVPIKWLKQFKT